MSLCPDTVAAPQHGVWESYFGSGVYGHKGGLSSYAGAWSFKIDVKKLWLSTDVKVNGGALKADVDINPWIFGVGVGYRL